MSTVVRAARVLGLGVMLVFAAGIRAAPIDTAAPRDVGLSPERLALVETTLREWVGKKELPGAVVMIARHGRLAYTATAGLQDAASGDVLREDSIFRLYSMTKPVVSIAAMTFVEEGRLSLQDPVARYIPEFKDMRVATETFDPKTGSQIFSTAPARRIMTVGDLLRHTAGFTYGPPLSTRTQVQKLYQEAGIWSQSWVLADFARALAKLPLVHEPGTAWEYGHSTDVLGRVVEVVAGKPLDAVLAERIFQPVRMPDTAFSLPTPKTGRLAQPQPDPYTGKTPELIDFTKAQGFFAGGHGLVGTAGDYLRFCQMLLNGGVLDGNRVLGPRTVEYIASNHMHAGIATSTGFLPGPGYGFGLGFGVRTERGAADYNGSVGDYYWGGYAGTYFWIDPREQLAVVFMTTEPVRRAQYRMALRQMVYSAIER
ncbi:MAG: serine hydrolase domain-containing protein [Betaproteobacteria bacterium]|jgi:CubicO group peptidase (beta-lactamase class C family)